MVVMTNGWLTIGPVGYFIQWPDRQWHWYGEGGILLTIRYSYIDDCYYCSNQAVTKADCWRRDIVTELTYCIGSVLCLGSNDIVLAWWWLYWYIDIELILLLNSILWWLLIMPKAPTTIIGQYCIITILLTWPLHDTVMMLMYCYSMTLCSICDIPGRLLWIQYWHWFIIPVVDGSEEVANDVLWHWWPLYWWHYWLTD